MGVITDTSILVRAEREGTLQLLTKALRDEDTGVSSITVSELLVEAHLADSRVRAEKRLAFIDNILSLMPPFDFTLSIARVHSKLLADLRRRGAMIGAHDLIIAATAMNLGWGVLTGNAREFGRVEGLTVIEP